ncbi:MAG: DUF2867 domain-containing protein, partial [Desulfovibrio sp.]|nr:DUF2867 domain-containing protein [Desulfovibrio sp.]
MPEAPGLEAQGVGVGQDTVFVAGATGYVGGRLVPLLLARGYTVVAAVRSPRKLAARPWGAHPALRILPADVMGRESLVQALQGCAAAFYL